MFNKLTLNTFKDDLNSYLYLYSQFLHLGIADALLALFPWPMEIVCKESEVKTLFSCFFFCECAWRLFGLAESPALMLTELYNIQQCS